MSNTFGGSHVAQWTWLRSNRPAAGSRSSAELFTRPPFKLRLCQLRFLGIHLQSGNTGFIGAPCLKSILPCEVPHGPEYRRGATALPFASTNQSTCRLATDDTKASHRFVMLRPSRVVLERLWQRFCPYSARRSFAHRSAVDPGLKLDLQRIYRVSPTNNLAHRKV